MRLDDYVAMVDDVAYEEITWVSMDRETGHVTQRRGPPPKSRTTSRS
jgi:hypothetical protein